ncbi:MAG: hypothetical protein ACAI35_01965 [Candidatus Methylacidiphilales bacterium]|nr:hypothetical protein [Candidatus Methylacidiphilales bacterium]
MTIKQHLATCGIRLDPIHRPEVLRLLREERDRIRNDRDHPDEPNAGCEFMLLYCFQLFCLGYVEDCLPIWRAKETNFDSACYLDFDLTLGAGIPATIEYLETIVQDKDTDAPTFKDAHNLLYQIRTRAGTGDLTNHESREEFQVFWERYFAGWEDESTSTGQGEEP